MELWVLHPQGSHCTGWLRSAANKDSLLGKSTLRNGNLPLQGQVCTSCTRPPSPPQAMPGPHSLPLVASLQLAHSLLLEWEGPHIGWPLGFSLAPPYWPPPASPTGHVGCGRQNYVTPPPNVFALITRSCTYVTLFSKGDFADVIALRTLRWRHDPGRPNGFLAVVSGR